MTESTRSPGRPRSDAVRQAILAAAFKVMAERGYAGFAVEVVAEAAGAGKTTIYRWWPNKADLAVDAFFEATKAELQLPQTGTAKEDFRMQITELAALLADSRGTVFATMLGGARTDPELAKALGERWLEPRRKWGYGRMAKAVADNETKPSIDIGAALGILYGPLYTPLLFGQQVPSPAQVEEHLNIALKAIFK
jgi:AcrR family transcriptional regulator